MPFELDFTFVNGHRFSWNSIEMRIGRTQTLGIKSINYKDSLKAGMVYGTPSNPMARTKGKAEYTCDFEIQRISWEHVLAENIPAGVGYGEVPLMIQVMFFETGSPTIIDEIHDFRIEEADSSNAEGTDASMIKVTGSVMRIIKNGRQIVTPTGFGTL